MPILQNNLALDSGNSPVTLNNGSGGQITTSGNTISTPHQVIVEEEKEPLDNSGSSGDFQNRASNFSLSNAAEVNLNNGEITPLKQEDANLTADEI